MTSLFLHVGLPKTGTTSLQRFLDDNRDALAARGFGYPKTGIPAAPHNWGHHGLVSALDDGDPGGLWHACAREVAGSPAAVVSSELFSRTLGAVSAGPILDAFAQWTVVPVIYLRRQDQFLEAAYNYNVKANGVTADIMTFAEEFAWRLDYVRLLEELERAFGRSTLRVRIYGRELVGGDTVSDFLSAIGLPFDDALRRPQVALNRGLTRDGMTLMLAANRRHADAPDALAAARREIVAANPAAAHTEHSMLSRTQRQAILSRYKAGNAAIAAAHFGRRVLFRDEYPRAVRQA